MNQPYKNEAILSVRKLANNGKDQDNMQSDEEFRKNVQLIQLNQKQLIQNRVNKSRNRVLGTPGATPGLGSQNTEGTSSFQQLQVSKTI